MYCQHSKIRIPKLKKSRNLPVMTNSSTHWNLVINLLLILCMPGTLANSEVCTVCQDFEQKFVAVMISYQCS